MYVDVGKPENNINTAILLHNGIKRINVSREYFKKKIEIFYDR